MQQELNDLVQAKILLEEELRQMERLRVQN